MQKRTTANSAIGAFEVCGKRIKEDAFGNICLDDIWALSGATIGRVPKEWRRTEGARRLIDRLTQRLSDAAGIARSAAKRKAIPIIYALRGRGGTFAHPILAAAYAGYLDADLEIEVRQVWLRFRAGDPTLADEILERASSEANKWVAARAMVRVKRREFTDALQAAGVSKYGYGNCTNAVYIGLFKKNAKQLKAERGVRNTRDGFDIYELAQVSVVEAMSAERIQYEGCRGDGECIEATSVSAGFIRDAIEKERASRRRRQLI